MARTKQTARKHGYGRPAPRARVGPLLPYPDPQIYTSSICARTWSDAFEQQTAGQTSKKQREGDAPTPNARFLAVLGVVLTHMRRSRAEEDPEPLLDLLGPNRDKNLAARVFDIASRPTQEYINICSLSKERTELWRQEKAFRSRVREAMGPGLGTVVLGLCSTCRGAWAVRQADGWLNIVGSLASWYRAVQKWKLALKHPLRDPFEPDAFHVALGRHLGLAATRKASALLRAVYHQHTRRLCRLALHLAAHRGRSVEQVSLSESRPSVCYSADYEYFKFPKSDEVLEQGCVVTGDDVATAAFLLRSLRPVTAARWGGSCGMEGVAAGAGEADEEGDGGGRWVLGDEAMVRGLVRALQQAGVVEVRGLQVLPRLAAELGHLARAVAGRWQEEDDEDEEEEEVVDGGAALRALVEGREAEETLAQVLTQERRRGARGEDGDDEDNEMEEEEEEEEREDYGDDDGDEENGMEEEEDQQQYEGEQEEEEEEEEEEEGWEEEGAGRAIDAAMVASALHSPQVGKKWRAAGLRQSRLSAGWQPVLPPDKKGLLQRLWLRELERVKEEGGMRAVGRHYRRFDGKAELLIRYLLQQDLEAVLGAAAGVVAKVRASGYPDLAGEDDNRRYDRQLCYLDLCLVESVLQDEDIMTTMQDEDEEEEEEEGERGRRSTGLIRPMHLIHKGDEEDLELLDYMLQAVRQYAQREGKVCGKPLSSSYRALYRGEHNVVARWLSMRARKVLEAMVAQMAHHYEAWAARAEDHEQQQQREVGRGSSDVAGSRETQGRSGDGGDEMDTGKEQVQHQARGRQQEGRVVLRVEDVCRAMRRLDRETRAGKARWWPFAACRTVVE